LLKLLLNCGSDLAGGLRPTFARPGRIREGALLGTRLRPRQSGRCPGQLGCSREAAKVLPGGKAAGQQHRTQAALQEETTEVRGSSGGARRAKGSYKRASGTRIKSAAGFREVRSSDDNMDVSILGDFDLHTPRFRDRGFCGAASRGFLRTAAALKFVC
jgi:hypothetical protein